MADENEMYSTAIAKVNAVSDAEAISRRDESLANLRRSRGLRGGDRFATGMADLVAAERKSAERLRETMETAVIRDLSGTPPTLSDAAGNFAPTAPVANAGGTGVEISNTDPASGEVATDPTQAGTVDPDEAAPILAEVAKQADEARQSTEAGDGNAVVTNDGAGSVSPTVSSAEETAKLQAGDEGTERTADPRDSVSIPDNWEEMGWPARRSIASQLTDDPVTKGEKADEVIRAELARRGG